MDPMNTPQVQQIQANLIANQRKQREVIASRTNNPNIINLSTREMLNRSKKVHIRMAIEAITDN